MGRDILRPHTFATQTVEEHVPTRPSFCSLTHYTHPNQCINMWQMWPTWELPRISDFEKRYPKSGTESVMSKLGVPQHRQSDQDNDPLSIKRPLGVIYVVLTIIHWSAVACTVHVHPTSTTISLPSSNTLPDQNSNAEIRQSKLGVNYQVRHLGIYPSRHVARRWMWSHYFEVVTLYICGN